MLAPTEHSGELGADIVQDGPHEDRPKVQGEHSNRPQHCQVALLPCTPGVQVCTANNLVGRLQSSPGTLLHTCTCNLQQQAGISHSESERVRKSPGGQFAL